MPTNQTTRDWYNEAILAHRSDACRHETSRRSNVWSGVEKSQGPGRLFSILTACRGIARSFGVPKNCPIRWATDDDRAAGKAGFLDAPREFHKPFIMLDKSLIQLKVQPDELLDIYCGVVLHEASHILHSRQSFKIADKLNPVENVYRGLWEDEHVEGQIRRKAPGYQCYIHAAKQRLIIDPFEVIDWYLLPDLDKVNLFLFLFIRAPCALPEQWQNFQPLNQSQTLLELFRNAVPECPVGEMDFHVAFQKTMGLWKAIRNGYPKIFSEYHKQRRGAAPEIATRMFEQVLATTVDEILIRHDGDITETVEALDQLSVLLVNYGGEFIAEDQQRVRNAANQIYELAFEISESESIMHGREGKRFGIPELIDINQRLNSVTAGVSPAEQQELSEIEQRESVPGNGRWRGGDADQSAIWLFPKPDESDQDMFDQLMAESGQQTAALRRVIPRLKTQSGKPHRGQHSGALDRRALFKYQFDDRIFIRQNPAMSRKKQVSIGLLIDESGSMVSFANLLRGNPLVGEILTQGNNGSSMQGRGDHALMLGALFVDALGCQNSVELEIYSHTTTTENRCQIKYLFGRRQTDPSVVTSYSPSNRNRDGIAIRESVRSLLKETTFDRKLLIVVSDGSPSDGDQGVVDARKEVGEARKQGVEVIGVAIENFRAEEIYGEWNTLHFHDLDQLIPQFRRRLTKLFR